MNKRIRAMLEKRVKSMQAARAILDVAAADGDRDLTADEQSAYDAHMADVTSLTARIEQEQNLVAAETAAGLQIPDNARITISENAEQDPSRGFRTFGEFAAAVRGAAMPGVRADHRLAIGAAAPSTFGNEAGGQDGGFLVPPQFSQEIFTLSLEEQALSAMTDNTPISGNSMVFPKDETTPWGTDGIRAYWQAEATAANATKPKLGVTVQRLHKLMALVPVTDELLEDSTALASYLPMKTAQSIRWKTDEAILFGTGAGQPQGVMNSNAVITQAKDSGQATNTLSLTNLTNMLSRLLVGSLSRSFWLMNPDLITPIATMTLGNYPIYLPVGSGGAKDSPYGMLLGRPVVLSEHAAAFSSKSDISLLDLSYYRTITSRGGIKTDTSMHLYFDADATAFRTTFRIDGQPKIAAPVTPPKSANTRSPFVTLAAR